MSLEAICTPGPAPLSLSAPPLAPILVVGNSRSLSAPMGLSRPPLLADLARVLRPELRDLRLLTLAWAWPPGAPLT